MYEDFTKLLEFRAYAGLRFQIWNHCTKV